MKISKKLEAEILQVMEEYWSSYFDGDLETWASYLPDHYRNIGTTKAEIWNSKKEIVDFTESILDQTVGLAELRDKKTQIIPYNPYIMVHELGELYVKAEEGWIYYAQVRLSSLLEQTTDGWKILHQHGSYPDSKTEDGEAFGFEELKVENKKLRDAINSRTMELEQKNRELEIEASLERVRAHTMAMHSSDELLEVGEILFKEVSILGIEIFNSGYVLMDDKEKVGWNYGVNPGDGTIRPLPTGIPQSGTKVLDAITASWEKQEAILVIELDPQETIAHQSYIAENMLNFSLTKEQLLALTPERLAIHTFNFKHGYLLMVGGARLTAEQQDMVGRFAKVFEQTYIRFLDLQKAEAQAREAQIEAALEKVRSRTMGMQKSEELEEVIKVLYDQFVQLDIFIEHTGFIIDYINRDDMLIWLADHNEIQPQITIPYFDSAHWNSFLEAKEKGKNFFANLLNFEEKNDFYKKLFQFAPDLPEDAKEFYLSCPGLAISTVLLDNVGLYIENFSGIPYSDEDNNILLRFGKVFQQTYTRFLDLQKAEAQAREAQIEAALEKVRSRTMAMQKSDELPEVANVLFLQVQSLGIPTWSAGYNILSKDKKSSTCIMSSEGQIQTAFQLPFTGEKSFREWLDAIQREDAFFVQELGGKALEEHYQYLFTLPDIQQAIDPLEEAGISFPTYQINHLSFFHHGFLLFITYEKVPEAHQIFRRFTTVFEQTYARFLDLQKAEEQAREAHIEAALERVRASSMAMQHSDELSDAAALMFDQVMALGVPAFSCGFNIWEEGDLSLMAWMSDPSGGGIKPYPIPLNEDPNFIRFEESRRKDEEFYVLEMRGKAMQRHYHYLRSTVPVFDEAFNKIEKEGHTLPETQIHHLVNFTHGNVMFITLEPCPEAHDIFKRFGKVFEQTYTRFLDLQKAEAQANKIKLVNQENERLLHSILPEQIAEQIRTGQQNVVKRFEHVSILFADIVGFTVLSEKLQPSKVVDILNGLFSKFDDLTDQYGLEKIKTIGDAYMVASGVPEEKTDHAMTMFQFAQDMLRSLEEYNQDNDSQMNIRIGISSGPVVAGVIGKKKFAYDLWGDTVNTAARMEAYGREGKIQVSPACYELLKNDFLFERIPGVEIKGKGKMDVYLWKASRYNSLEQKNIDDKIL